MKTALSTLADRIAPVFDVVDGLLLVECESGRVLNRETLSFASGDPSSRAHQLRSLGVETLLCGALSSPFRLALEDCGIRVIPFLTGKTEELLQAWVCEGLDENHFRMPGCRGAGRNRRGGGRGHGRHADGACVCPLCGHRIVHAPGTPCQQLPCPRCGTAMARH